jgi:predicted dehydrogenase
MGRHHVRHLRAMPDVQLAVVDPALLPSDDPTGAEAVVVATPTPTHLEVALPWLERGVPCLVEKPVAEDLEAARRLAAFPKLRVGHVERFNPAFRVLADRDLRFVQAERLAAWNGRSPDVDVVLDLMVHDLDLFLELLRPTGDTVERVMANGIAVATGALDLVQARLETRQGRVATITASRVSRGPSRRLRAFGPGEYWSLDLYARQAARATWGGGPDGGGALVETIVPLPEEDALALQLGAFLAEVRGEAPRVGPRVASGAEALAALELAVRVQEAVRAWDAVGAAPGAR